LNNAKFKSAAAGLVNAKTGFKLLGRVSLDNAIVDDPDITTGDHDGRAVLLRAGQ